jgi:hypothetical protein
MITGAGLGDVGPTDPFADLVVFETPNSAEQESTEWKEPGIISNLTKT